MAISRRDFLAHSGLFGVTLLLPHSVKALASLAQPPVDWAGMSPIAILNSFKSSDVITGDTPDEAHNIFWSKDSFIAKKGELPKAQESYDVVIVGGGLSALTAAYYLTLENKKVVILEGHPRLGGNAKAERFKNTYMGLGSAYIVTPEEGGDIDQFLKKIGVSKKLRKMSHDSDAIAVNGKIINGFWEGNTDPKNKDQFVRANEVLNDVYENSYPDLPLFPGEEVDRDLLHRLDRMKFQDWVKQEIPDIHPHIEEYFHQYCWSSFGCAYDEISAAQALNFITSDLQGIEAMPGGNAGIAEGIFQAIKNKNIEIKTTAFCVDIRESEGGVYVCYHENNQVLKAVLGKKCIVTAPKMVAKKLIDKLSTDQFKAMDSMVYHAYLVGNVVLNKKIEPKYYDVYSLKGSLPTNEREDSMKRVFTDITTADWANPNEAERSALTLYMPLPYAMAQQFLFNPTVYSKYDQRVRGALAPFMNDLGLNWSDIDGLRLTRYGHALPVAQTGGIASGLFERASRSINNKIFFANQDNWGNPCFETSYAVGKVAAYQALGKDI